MPDVNASMFPSRAFMRESRFFAVGVCVLHAADSGNAFGGPPWRTK